MTFASYDLSRETNAFGALGHDCPTATFGACRLGFLIRSGYVGRDAEIGGYRWEIVMSYGVHRAFVHGSPIATSDRDRNAACRSYLAAKPAADNLGREDGSIHWAAAIAEGLDSLSQLAASHVVSGEILATSFYDRPVPSSLQHCPHPVHWTTFLPIPANLNACLSIF